MRLLGAEFKETSPGMFAAGGEAAKGAILPATFATGFVRVNESAQETFMFDDGTDHEYNCNC